MTNKNKYFANIVIPPGETLLEMLEVHDMTRDKLAKRLNMSKENINQLIKGEISLTEEIALKLEKLFKLPLSFWLNLEKDYQNGSN